jgi:hypothetical protein
MRLNALLLCLLPTLVLAAPSFAQTITINQGDDVAAKFATVPANGTVSFGSGTFTVTQPLEVKTGVTITGVMPAQGATLPTYLVFSLPGGDQSSYGFVIDGGAQNVTIEWLDITSNMGLVQMSKTGTYSQTTIQHNNLQYGGGSLSDGSLVYGISITVSNNHTYIINNYFHDSPNSVRNWSIFFASDSKFSNNEFYNINDGGQLEYMGANVQFNQNYGTYIHRMGQETAGSSSTSEFQVDGNVFYDYVSPYNDTEGVSICIYGNDTQIENNYFDANIAPGSSWGAQSGDAAGGPNRFGYAIEASGTPCTVSGNTLVGTWAEDVSCMSANILVSGNSVYGWGLWGDFVGEPGPTGYGSVSAGTNSIDRNASDAPAPPANTFAGVWGTGAASYSEGTYTPTSGSGSSGSTGTGTGTTTGSSGSGSGGGSSGTPSGGIYSETNTNTPAFPVTGVVVKVTSDTTVTVSWNSPSANIVSTVVNIISTVGRQNFPSTTVPTSALASTTPSVDIGSLHPGWLIDFTVVATGANGTTYTSSPVTAYLPGNSVAPWSGLLWGGISVLQSDPYTN